MQTFFVKSTLLISMKLYKTRSGFVVESENTFYPVPSADWDTLVNRDDLHEHLGQLIASATPGTQYQDWIKTGLLAPIGHQEVWASGVTYLRSRNARMEESKKAGGETGGASASTTGSMMPSAPNCFLSRLPNA